jgi:hypothetical protein
MNNRSIHDAQLDLVGNFKSWELPPSIIHWPHVVEHENRYTNALAEQMSSLRA